MDNIQDVVKEPVTPAQASDATVTPASEDAGQPIQDGSKTDPNLLLKSLQQERDKVRQLEEQISTLTSSTLSEDQQSDEGKALQAEIKSLRSEITEVKQNSLKSELQSSNPVFKEKWTEFETFRADPENKGMNLKTAAKAFLIENGLLEPPRKGLEKTTGGTRQPLSTNPTVDDIKHLRETNPREWKRLAISGALKME